MKQSNMPLTYTAAFLAVICAVSALSAATQEAGLSCQNIAAPMEDGARYTGVVRNEDYRFSAIIPPGRAGWGVRAPAPFHGFIVPLDGSGRYREGESCIDLYVGVRVRLPEDDSERQLARAIKRPTTVGNQEGSERIEKEVVGGRPFTVVTIRVDLRHPSSGQGYMSLTLISPANKYPSNRRTFDKFLSDLTFW
jgi:hypothetical protein